eukprot:TRINITY_DN38537_c0_g2_i2.p1 TRINITY_DN38537_c0_g2~~TRINITY_DN38537_c0_g2_i2.p1  ORF type:complete len:304 (-),score=89.93 TRINITY_DN38537_c0_g2_i2:203-1114(-)
MSTQRDEEVLAAPKKEREALEGEWVARIQAEEAKLDILKGEAGALDSEQAAADALEASLAVKVSELEGEQMQATAALSRAEAKLQARVSMLEKERISNKKEKRAVFGSKELWPVLSSASHWHSAQAGRTQKAAAPMGRCEQRAVRAEWVRKAPLMDFKTAFLFNEDANHKVNWMKNELAKPVPEWKPQLPKRPATALPGRSTQQFQAATRPATGLPGRAKQRNRPGTRGTVQLKEDNNVQHTGGVPLRRPVSPNVMTVVMGGRPRTAHPRLRYKPESPEQILSPTLAPTVRRPPTRLHSRRSN